MVTHDHGIEAAALNQLTSDCLYNQYGPEINLNYTARLKSIAFQLSMNIILK
jgi:hypothetical protein